MAMSLGFEDACGLEQRTVTSEHERVCTIPGSDASEFDAYREASLFVTSLLPPGATAITDRVESKASLPAKTITKVDAPVDRVVAPKRDPVELSRHWRHVAFLREASRGDHAAITPQIARQLMIAWSYIRRVTQNRMPVPAAMTGPDGQMFYSWDRGHHHMELEIIPDEPAFFFYRDRRTGKTWSEDYVVGDRLSADVISRLELFYQDQAGNEPANTT